MQSNNSFLKYFKDKSKKVIANDSCYRSDSVEFKIFNPDVLNFGSVVSNQAGKILYVIVSTKDILPGEMIFSEKPFISLDSSLPALTQVESIKSQISTLTKNKMKELSIFLSLGKSTNAQKLPLSIFDEFSIPFNNNQRGVFVLFSKLRHNCSPNIEISISNGIVIAHSTRFIHKGTEITRTHLDELNLPYLKRKEQHNFLYSSNCTCSVCKLGTIDLGFRVKDDFLRERIQELQIHFYNLIQCAPFEAINEAHALIDLLVKSAKDNFHFNYTDISLLRKLHLKIYTLYLKNSGSLQLSIEHLKLAAGYSALGLGWNSPDTLKILSYLERKSATPILVNELPIFAIESSDTLSLFLSQSIEYHSQILKIMLPEPSSPYASHEPSRPQSPTQSVDTVHRNTDSPSEFQCPPIVSYPVKNNFDTSNKFNDSKAHIKIPNIEFVKINSKLELSNHDTNKLNSKPSLNTYTMPVTRIIPEVSNLNTSRDIISIKNHRSNTISKKSLKTVNKFKVLVPNLNGVDLDSISISSSSSTNRRIELNHNKYYSSNRDHRSPKTLSPQDLRSHSKSDYDDDVSVMTDSFSVGSLESEHSMFSESSRPLAKKTISNFSIWASKNKSKKRNMKSKYSLMSLNSESDSSFLTISKMEPDLKISSRKSLKNFNINDSKESEILTIGGDSSKTCKIPSISLFPDTDKNQSLLIL